MYPMVPINGKNPIGEADNQQGSRSFMELTPQRLHAGLKMLIFR